MTGSVEAAEVAGAAEAADVAEGSCSVSALQAACRAESRAAVVGAVLAMRSAAEHSQAPWVEAARPSTGALHLLVLRLAILESYFAEQAAPLPLPSLPSQSELRLHSQRT